MGAGRRRLGGAGACSAMAVTREGLLLEGGAAVARGEWGRLPTGDDGGCFCVECMSGLVIPRVGEPGRLG